MLSARAEPLVVDLGYGASPVTTVELARPRLEFRRGGFELAGTRPVLVRAFNVLRPYAEADVVPS